MKAKYECGIDLGTTNSCVAIINEQNDCEIIENNTDRMIVTPSAVQVSKTGRITVGQRAYNFADGRYVKKEFKRDMGTDTIYSFPQSEKTYTPIELSAEVLKSMKRDVEARVHRVITSAVITVPAAFQELQIKATKEAARLAGFSNVVLLQEPVAAAVAYGANVDKAEGNWLVFDYGGGTLDVAVVSTEHGQIEVINNKGNNRMGGKDLDKAIYQKIVLPELQKKYHISDELSSKVRTKSLYEVEKCKMELSSQNKCIFELYDVTDDAGEEIDFGMEITRAEFIDAVEPIIEETIDIARDALSEASLTEKDLKRIVLVGGSTFVPLVREKLREEFHIDLECSIDPMTVVAKGASMYANQIYVEQKVVDTEQIFSDGIKAAYQYDDTTICEKVTVVGKFQNYTVGMIDRIRFISEDGAMWQGGWNELLDPQNGVFSYDVTIFNHNGVNNYCLNVVDKAGTEVKVDASMVSISYGGGLKLAAPPLPFNIGIMTSDGHGNIVDWLLKKNTRLPSSNSGKYILNKKLDPGQNDVFTLMVYEGENTFNPPANHLIGKIQISSADLPRVLSEGEEIEISIDVDISRVVRVTALIPKFEIFLSEEQIMGDKAQYQNIYSDIEHIKNDISDVKERIKKLAKKNVDVNGLSSSLESLASGLNNDTLMHGDNDDAQQMLEKYRNIESEVIKKERDAFASIQENKDLGKINNCEKMIIQYGNESDRKEFEFYKQKYVNETQAEFKKHFLDTIVSLKSRVCWASYIWLKERYYYYKDHQSIKYTNKQQAKYWMDQAYQNVLDEDADRLKTCIKEINKLVDNTDDGKTLSQEELADIRLA